MTGPFHEPGPAGVDDTPARSGLSRRNLLLGLGALAAGGALATGGRLAVVELFGPSSPQVLVRSTFAPHIGSAFQVRGTELGRLALRLRSVTDLPDVKPTTPGVPDEDRYSLVFEGPADRPLTQGTYELRHGAVGDFPLFVVPMDQADGVARYEAIFNRLEPTRGL